MMSNVVDFVHRVLSLNMNELIVTFFQVRVHYICFLKSFPQFFYMFFIPFMESISSAIFSSSSKILSESFRIFLTAAFKLPPRR